MHERFAAWLEGLASGFVELDELAGYHLEQAWRYKHELGEPDAALATRAGARLAAAGRRALWRSDYRGAASLLERALELTRPLRLDVHLELDLAGAWWEEAPARAVAIAEDAARRAHAQGDELGEVLARIVTAVNRAVAAPDADVDELEALARSVVHRFEAVDDHAALAHVWHAIVLTAYFRCRFAEMAQGSEQALHYARLAGQGPRHLFFLEDALSSGPMPADEALRVLDAALPANAPPRPLLNRARLLAMLGRFDEAWPLARAADARWRELSGKGSSHELAEVAALAGDYEEALACLRVYCEWCEEHGHVGWLSTYAPMQGRFLCKLGRHDEAEPLAERGRELGDEQDAMTQMLWRQVKALVHASRGEHAEAERLAREAVAISEPTDSLEFQANALCDLAEVLHAAGRLDEATSALEQALKRFDSKRSLAMLKQVRLRMVEMRGPTASAELA